MTIINSKLNQTYRGAEDYILNKIANAAVNDSIKEAIDLVIKFTNALQAIESFKDYDTYGDPYQYNIHESEYGIQISIESRHDFKNIQIWYK